MRSKSHVCIDSLDSASVSSGVISGHSMSAELEPCTLSISVPSLLMLAKSTSGGVAWPSNFSSTPSNVGLRPGPFSGNGGVAGVVGASSLVDGMVTARAEGTQLMVVSSSTEVKAQLENKLTLSTVLLPSYSWPLAPYRLECRASCSDCQDPFLSVPCPWRPLEGLRCCGSNKCPFNR